MHYFQTKTMPFDSSISNQCTWATREVQSSLFVVCVPKSLCHIGKEKEKTQKRNDHRDCWKLDALSASSPLLRAFLRLVHVNSPFIYFFPVVCTQLGLFLFSKWMKKKRFFFYFHSRVYIYSLVIIISCLCRISKKTMKERKKNATQININRTVWQYQHNQARSGDKR